ncbi:MAG: cytidine deaminase [Candidatus Eisenbacteria bacterium]|nr:cytidine deaminase [Candidatus Eisenbacteria bacterium]
MGATMDAIRRRLEQQLKRAYAPYSGFRVAAALETDAGTLVLGCNVENASFGLGLCAERVALFRALAEGHRKFSRLYLLTTDRQPVAPCGACCEALRQIAPGLAIHMFGAASKNAVESSLAELLPG